MNKNKLEKILIIPDAHIPYHDKRAYALMFKAAQAFKPDRVIIMGDYADFYAASSFSKNPNRIRGLDEELKQVIVELKNLKTLKASKYVFIEGNHCNRLTRYLMDKAPELYNVISIPKILKLDELNYEFIPYKDYYKVGHMHFTHDLGNAGRTAHLKALDSFQDNIVIGHVHRMHYAVEGDARGKKHCSATFGWLGDEDAVDYMHKAKIKREWSHGFGLGYHEVSTGNVHLVPVPILDGNSCLVEGKLIKL